MPFSRNLLFICSLEKRLYPNLKLQIHLSPTPSSCLDFWSLFSLDSEQTELHYEIMENKVMIIVILQYHLILQGFRHERKVAGWKWEWECTGEWGVHRGSCWPPGNAGPCLQVHHCCHSNFMEIRKVGGAWSQLLSFLDSCYSLMTFLPCICHSLLKMKAFLH